MWSLPKAVWSLALLICSLGGAAVAQEHARYACVTAAFQTAGDEAEFIEANLAKRFDVRVSQDVIEVTTRSDGYAETTHRYEVAVRDILGVIAFRPGRLDDRMIIPYRPEELWQQDGRIPMSISLQGVGFANTWILECRPAE